MNLIWQIGLLLLESFRNNRTLKFNQIADGDINLTYPNFEVNYTTIITSHEVDEWLQKLPFGKVLVRGFDAETYQHWREFVYKALQLFAEFPDLPGGVRVRRPAGVPIQREEEAGGDVGIG